MSGYRVHYESYMDDPALARVCLECTHVRCAGICDNYRNAVRAHIGMKPLADRPKRVKPAAVRLRRGRETALEYNGESHTLREWERITGIPYSTLYMRLHRGGMSVAEALGTPLRDVRPAQRYQIGEERLTVAEWARRMGVSERRIYRRLQAGCSLEEALETVKGGAK